MKKLCIIAISAVLCLGFALPAVADLSFHGAITFDLWRMTWDDKVAGANNDRSTTQFEIYTPINYLYADYSNDDKTLGGRFTVYMGRTNDAAWKYDGGNNYIWWKPNPKLKIQIGNQAQIVGGSVGPPTHLKGSDIIVLITYGNLHTSTKLGITGDYKINDMMSLKVGLYDVDDDGTLPLALPVAAGATQVNDETSIPRLDFALPINYKLGGTGIFVQPKGTFFTKSFENVAAGTDDSYTITAFGLDGRVKFGPVTGMLEFMMCTNIAGANYTGGYTGPMLIGTSIEDTETTLYWLGVNYGINPKMGIDVFYGALNDENSAANYELDRTSYGLRFRYAIFANFLVYPHLQMYDYGENNGTATQIGANLWLAF
jgi:opacity protein-like surface antigen